MKADYYRYMCEVLSGEELEDAVQKASENYEEGRKISETLPGTNPVRLGLALSYSVLLSDVKNLREDARKTTQDSLDRIQVDPKSLDEDMYKDAAAIMKVTKSNLVLWNSEMEEDKKRIASEKK
ncbi:MAG: 14-3-3 family protein [Candidatus Pacebacteria bacterium]|nr:14-3-3 family protein [Candidatus Paceibacterota bacterium]